MERFTGKNGSKSNLRLKIGDLVSVTGWVNPETKTGSDYSYNGKIVRIQKKEDGSLTVQVDYDDETSEVYSQDKFHRIRKRSG